MDENEVLKAKLEARETLKAREDERGGPSSLVDDLLYGPVLAIAKKTGEIAEKP